MRRSMLASTLLVVLACATTAQASSPDLSDLGRTLREQRALQEKVEARKGVFRDLPASERDRLLQAQSELLTLLEAGASFEAMPAAERERAAGLLSEIAAITARAEVERLICRKEKRSGSHLAQTQCRTAAQIREERENARKLSERPMQCVGEICKGG